MIDDDDDGDDDDDNDEAQSAAAFTQRSKMRYPVVSKSL